MVQYCYQEQKQHFYMWKIFFVWRNLKTNEIKNINKLHIILAPILSYPSWSSRSLAVRRLRTSSLRPLAAVQRSFRDVKPGHTGSNCWPVATITAWVALFARSLHGRPTCLHLFSGQLKLTKPGSPPASYRSFTSSSAALAPAPRLSPPRPSLGGPL